MRSHRSLSVLGSRRIVWGFLVLAGVPISIGDPAHARVHRHHHHHHRSEREYSPPYAAIVVDANTGKVLHAANADSVRHPASLTKIMTLYLLFEQLDAGKLKLDSRLRASEHAVDQDPTKLGLEPGQTIQVEDAIKAIVTRSANDVAVVIAEAIGRDEESFAALMTRKAHALGMTRTVYVNASGLPAEEQVTTARDQALLGRAIQDRFPRYYRYFSTTAFHYHGTTIRNHNHLLGSVEGVDGIKTGYTRASGFNLVSSMHRHNKHLVAVVMGGSSSGSRDAKMRELLQEYVSEASNERTVPTIVEASEPASPRTRLASAASESAMEHVRAKPAPVREAPAREATYPPTASSMRVAPGSAHPIAPIPVKTIAVRAGPVQAAVLSPLVAPVAQASIAPAWAANKLAAPPEPAQKVAVARPPPPAPAHVSPPQAPAAAEETAAATAEPDSELEPLAPPRRSAAVEAAPAPAGASGVLGTLTFQPNSGGTERPPPAATNPAQQPATAHSGWMIQLGAFADESEAKERLRSAQSMAHDLLGSADGFTERVVKGSKELYRARFAGLDKDQAEAACHYFKRNDIACMALKN
jgi:D-alanyl-D-alanine carboxypeptidase